MMTFWPNQLTSENQMVLKMQMLWRSLNLSPWQGTCVLLVGIQGYPAKYLVSLRPDTAVFGKAGLPPIPTFPTFPTFLSLPTFPYYFDKIPTFPYFIPTFLAHGEKIYILEVL